MLQCLYTYVAKVCYECFIYVFWTYVASVFIWMLHMFYTYVACILFGCCVCLQSFFRCFSSVPGLQTYVASVAFGFLKVDRVLYLSSSPSTVSPQSSSSWHRLGICSPPPLLDAGDVRGNAPPRAEQNGTGNELLGAGVRTPYPSRRPDARKPVY
jgi:hypothetical protein